MPNAPILSGMRAPDDSPRKTNGRPRSVAVRCIWLIFFILVAADDAPFTVKSFTTPTASRPSMRPYPHSLPSPGLESRSSGRAEVANRPDSRKLPVSKR